MKTTLLIAVGLLIGLALAAPLGCGQGGPNNLTPASGNGPSTPTDADTTEDGTLSDSNADTGGDSSAGDTSDEDANGDGTTDDDDTSGNDDATTDQEAKLTVKMQADFSTAALVSDADNGGEQSGQTARDGDCPDPPATQDYPGLSAGADCDGDEAVVQYITPTRFVVACKRLALVAADGHTEEIIPDTGRLADAEVLDLTAPITLAEMTIPAANYVAVEAELYYYELVMPLNDPPADQGLRLFLSDDDFPSEGDVGHHQGDITLIDAEGSELGFVVEGAPWTVDSLSPVHQDLVYAGSTDPETGHRRGPFGDTTLWDSEPFMQGSTQDVFIVEIGINLDLTATVSDAALTVVFNVADSWFYEDYEGDGHFAPCGDGQGNPGDACFDGGAWAPLFPQPQAVIEAAAE